MSRMPFEISAPTTPKRSGGLKPFLLLALTLSVLVFCTVLVTR